MDGGRLKATTSSTMLTFHQQHVPDPETHKLRVTSRDGGWNGRTDPTYAINSGEIEISTDSRWCLCTCSATW